MEKSSTLFVGLDAHKNSIDIATADGTAAETAKFDTWSALEGIWPGWPRRCEG